MSRKIERIFDMIPYLWEYEDAPEEIVELVLATLLEESDEVAQATVDKEEEDLAFCGGVAFSLFPNGLCIVIQVKGENVRIPQAISVNGKIYFVYAFHMTRPDTTVRKIHFPANLQSIACDAMKNLKSLESVTWGGNGKYGVVDGALYGLYRSGTPCKLLWFPPYYGKTSCHLPESMRAIDANAFANVIDLPFLEDWNLGCQYIMISKERKLLLGIDNNLYHIVSEFEENGRKVCAVELTEIRSECESLKVCRNRYVHYDNQYREVEIVGIRLDNPCGYLREIIFDGYKSVPYVFLHNQRMLPNLVDMKLTEPQQSTKPLVLTDDDDDYQVIRLPETFVGKCLEGFHCYDKSRNEIPVTSFFDEDHGPVMEIVVDDSNPDFCSVDGVVYDKTMKSLMLFPYGRRQKNFEIPYGIEIVDALAFYRCKNLRHVVIPDSVKVLSNNAFAGCGIDEIHIPPSVATLGWDVFSECPNLKEIVIPHTVKNIDSAVISACPRLEKAEIQCEMVELSGFKKCKKLQDVSLPAGIVSIEQEVFLGCLSLKTVRLPESVLFIKDEAFKGCKSLEEVQGTRKVRYFGKDTFRNCGILSKIYIPQDAIIDKGAFKNTPLYPTVCSL